MHIYLNCDIFKNALQSFQSLGSSNKSLHSDSMKGLAPRLPAQPPSSHNGQSFGFISRSSFHLFVLCIQKRFVSPIDELDASNGHPSSLPRTPDIDSEAASSHLSAGSAGSLHDIGRVRYIFTSHSIMHFYQTGNKPVFVNTFLLVHGLFNLLMLVNSDCKDIICINNNFECVFRIWG